MDEVVEDGVVAVRHETEQAWGDEAEQADSELGHPDHADDAADHALVARQQPAARHQPPDLPPGQAPGWPLQGP